MKNAPPEMELKSSDIVRANRIPGFEMNLLRTGVRVTRRGWAACYVATCPPQTGQIEGPCEHRFTFMELDSISDAISNLSRNDLPIPRISFVRESEQVIFETLEFKPFNIESATRSAAFHEVWNLRYESFQASSPNKSSERTWAIRA